MRFTVRLTHANGEVLVREFEADSAESLRARVLAEGGFPLAITRTDTAFRSRNQLKTESLVLFNQELLALLRAGIPLLQSLELLVGHGKDVQLRRSLTQVVELVREGMSFSDALEQAGSFPPIYRSNVVAGERSGTLPEVLARWLSFQKFAQTSRRRIIEALFYPTFLVLVLILALGVIFNVVLPRFAEFYAGGDIEMPFFTRILLGAGKFVSSTLWLQGLILIGLVVLGRWMVASEAGRKLAERLLLMLPKVGTLYRMYHSSVFCRTLGVLLSGGLPVVQALEVVQRTSPSERMKAGLLLITDKVRAGSSLHLSLEQAKVLDPLAVEMIRVGEQSSALPEMLDHVANFFDSEVEKATTAVTSLIGPVLILFMGVVVLGLLLAIYVPLFNASSMVR
ncbi:MAG: type II secretion system F family protein [Geothrix sp.]|uniref:type II secretion system F family protein n=1 Tax=Geothrix sp. TaxID=1962974 RepID=UPI0017BC9727|nr:type II secretion system F family protein [Geothrix sp.]NWJ41539.1 type II secretion system F family protein [Geothrix sp.]WIL20476.1 MAG: type II secretion system F family protein [Geothrix sp.]